MLGGDLGEMVKDGLVPFEELAWSAATFADLEPDPQVRDLLTSISPPTPS